jgi:hypothetical protein
MPFGWRVARAIDVDVADAEAPQVDDVRADGVDAPPGIRLELDADAQPVALRRAHHCAEADILARALPPPRADHLVDPGGRDVVHLRPQHGRIAARVSASQWIELRGNVKGRRVSALRPVGVGAVVPHVRIPRIEEDRARGRAGLNECRQGEQ